MGERTFGLAGWVERLGEAELPALASVVKNLQETASSAASVSVQRVADVLLHDAALTAKVLRVANSVYYNPSQEVIKTISRAIVLMGFENVRLIGLSVSLVDGLLTRVPREQLQELLARSFHAAVQARNIAGYVLAKHQEEVFIAALLHHMGEMAFWGCAGGEADQLAEAIQQPGADVEQVAREFLGVSFRQLTQGLLKNWNLGETASLAHNPKLQNDPSVRAVTLGVRISEAALDGWDCDNMQALVAEIAEFTSLTPDDALLQVLASAEEAVKVVTTFGAAKLSKLIPNTDPDQVRLQQEQRRARLLQPNLLLMQLSLQELGLLLARKDDVQLVLETLLRGLHQGAGLERVVVAVLADGQSCFRCKRAEGEGAERWQQEFMLPVDQPQQQHIFSYVLRSRETLWMGVPATHALNDLVTLPLRQWIGGGMFFIAPLLAGKREIGVVYADSRLSGRTLKHEQFVAFQRFTQLASRCLEALTKR